MPAKTLLGAGTFALLAGIFLYCVLVPISSQLEEEFFWDNWTPEIVASWLCLSLAGAGALLVFRGAFRLLPKRVDSGRSLQIFPGMKLRNVFPLQRHPPVRPITQLPNFGLICGPVFSVLFMIQVTFSPYPPYGLPIDLRTSRYANEEKSPWKKPLSVYLGVGEKFYVNGEPVAREALDTKLREELGHRLDWTVYFEADRDTLNMDAIYAMDTIQGTGAKLVWITPKMRAELQLKSRAAR